MAHLTRELQIFEDPWIGRSRAVLLFAGTIYLLFGVFLGPLMTMGFWVDPNTPRSVAIGATVGFSLFSLLLCGGFAIANFVAAAGLKRGAKWGWFLTMAIALIYAPSGCMPFGVLLLIGMLNERTRTSFLA